MTHMNIYTDEEYADSLRHFYWGWLGWGEDSPSERGNYIQFIHTYFPIDVDEFHLGYMLRDLMEGN